MVHGRSQAHSPKTDWEFGLPPLQLVQGGTKDSAQSFSGDAIELGQEVTMGSGVNSSQDEHHLGQRKAGPKETEFCVWIFEVRKEGGHLLHLFLPFPSPCSPFPFPVNRFNPIFNR